MAERYRRKVSALRQALNQEDRQAEASGLLRGLIEKVVLTPSEGENGLQIDLYGDLAGILNTAAGGKDMKKASIIERLELSAVNDNSP